MLHCGNRAPWGDVFVGGQVGGADLDMVLWNESNAYGPHRGSSYWGWWGFSYETGERRLATALSIAEATAYEGKDEIARCPAATLLHFTHGVIDYLHDSLGGAAWEWDFINCATGASTSGSYNTHSAETSPVTLATPANGSYLLRVRVSLGRPAYHGLPVDYLQVTEQTSVPAEYKWVASNGKSYFYDPIWNVGAAPSDPNHLLRTEQAKAIEERANKKNPGWSGEIMLIGEDGEPEATGGEWSALKVQVGAGAWIGDRNSHINACFQALWRASEDSLVAVAAEPRLRAVGALAVKDDALWIGGYLAGRSGPQPCIIKFLEASEHNTSNPTAQWSVFCECAMAGSKMVNSITWVKGVLHAVTPCDVLILDEVKDVLMAHHPGGRCGGTLLAPGVQTFVRTNETDFSGSQKFTNYYNTILSGDLGKEKVWRGTSHHVFGALGYKGRNVFYAETDATDSGKQYLARFNGQDRELVATWNKVKFDLGQIGVAGQYIYGFGHRPDLSPCAVRYDPIGADTILREFECNYHIRNQITSLSADGQYQTLFVIGKGLNSDGTPADGWGLYELDVIGGNQLCSFWNADLEKFSLARNKADAAGLDVTKLPPYLAWVPVAGQNAGGHWTSSATLPGNTPYLELLPDVSFLIAYHKPSAVTMAYDPNIWNLICFEVEDGRITDPIPTPSCKDPTCVIPPIPGVVIRIVRYPREGETLEVPVDVVDVLARVVFEDEVIDGLILDELYPWLWLSIDGELTVSDSPGGELTEDDLLALKEFNIRARGISRFTPLPRPALSSVRVCYLIPPNYRLPAKLVKDVS